MSVASQFEEKCIVYGMVVWMVHMMVWYDDMIDGIVYGTEFRV
jgi:hypothetical protein